MSGTSYRLDETYVKVGTDMMRKGQVKRLDGRDAAGQAKFVASLFGVAA
jgi:hypothetical protein